MGDGRSTSADPLPDSGWFPILAGDDLVAGRPTKVTLEGLDLFVYRGGEHLYALANRCSHMGGPLHRGVIGHVGEEPTVTCPLHGSLFRLADGRVLRGPAARAQQVFEVRERDGVVEVRDPS
jgi:nitrite reductase/ring-hydroxylating ferredoxin subunit